MRIVSLCPSLTELLCDLGLATDLVAVTEYCVHPADIVSSIEKVGGTKNPRIERIVELAPDLVLLNEEEKGACWREESDLLTLKSTLQVRSANRGISYRSRQARQRRELEFVLGGVVLGIHIVLTACAICSAWRI